MSIDVDKVFAHLQKTKVGYVNLKVKPPKDKNSAWYKALVELGIIVPDTPPQSGMGGKLAAAFPPLTGLQARNYGGATLSSRVEMDGPNAGGWHIQNVNSVNSSPDAFKFAGGASDIILERFTIDGWGGGYAQGVNLQRAPKRIRLISGTIQSVGNDKFSHCLYVGSGSEDVLVAGVLMNSSAGEIVQWYPGPCDGVMTHCTLVGSPGQEELAVDGAGADVTVWNSIIHGDIQLGSGILRLRGTCCVTGDLPSGVDTTGATIIREDPGFDDRFRPSNPKLLSSGDIGWTPAIDCFGKPFTRATVGAVAA